MIQSRLQVVAVIPAHMASVRFPGKILYELHGLPMIEHVRRRALMCDVFSDVFVATCDKEIAAVIKDFGGNVKMTSDQHRNGTSRVSEAIQDIEATHVVLLQGDEPLLLPRHVEEFVDTAIEKRQTEIAKNLGFEIADHSLAIYGTCSKKNCSRKKKATK